MRVLVVGGGGREHALSWALARSPGIGSLLAAPGNAGIEELARCVPVGADDISGLVDLAVRERVDLVVIGPDAAVAAGLADELTARGLPAFGPSRAAARIEGSKSWAKDLCRRHGIPAAAGRAFTDPAAATAYLDEAGPPYVVKADGLALGKGVTVTPSRSEAETAIRRAMVDRAYGEAGSRIVVEEHLEGPEVSAFALSDGRSVVPLAMAQDFKRVHDGDAGPNTGGMGSYSPTPFVGPEVRARIMSEIMEPAIHALAAEGVTYRGCLYGGLMLTSDGPKVLEFNARFGDPETQAILPRLDDDLLALLRSSAEGTLDGREVRWRAEACVSVILASGGYPGAHRTGRPIQGLEAAAAMDGVTLFHAGTARGDGRVMTAGGRVLAVSALGKDLAAARARSYEAVARISFEGMHHRTDIAKEAAGG